MKEEKSKFFKYCNICQLNAKFLCFECDLYFCESCYDLIHSRQKDKSHKKENINQFIPIELKCSIHSKERLNLFCINDKGNYFINTLTRNLLFNVLF